LNPGPPPYHGGALPLSYASRTRKGYRRIENLPSRTSRRHTVVLMPTSFLRPAGLIVIACLAFSACSGDGNDGATSSPSPRPVTEEGRALTSLVEEAQALTYHATYRIGGEQPEEGSISVEFWRKGDRIRLDQELRSEDRTVRSSGFRLAGQTIGCVREGEAPWRCTTVDQPRPSPGVAIADPLIGGLVDDLSRADLTVGTEEIDGRQARCYKAADPSREVCVTGEGIAVRVGTPQSRLELAELERDVEDSVFDPPAEPTQPGNP
jgi:hypothetical protein